MEKGRKEHFDTQNRKHSNYNTLSELAQDTLHEIIAGVYKFRGRILS